MRMMCPSQTGHTPGFFLKEFCKRVWYESPNYLLMHISNYPIINAVQQSNSIFVCLAAAASVSILGAYLLIQMLVVNFCKVIRHQQLVFLLDMDPSANLVKSFLVLADRMFFLVGAGDGSWVLTW